MLKIIVAADSNNVIGYQGKIPWHVSEDLKLFKKLTLNNIVIMGKLTFEGLPIKPLPQRKNIVLTTDKSFTFPGVEVVNDAEKLFDLDAFVIGGAKTYKLFLDSGKVEKIFLSRIKKNYTGDVFFPDIKNFQCISQEDYKEFTLETYIKYGNILFPL